jgi:hypothetical protein
MAGSRGKETCPMPPPFAGGCACGAIRYTCTVDPLLSLNCHCRDCQREMGSGFAPIMVVPKAAFTVTHGSPHYFALLAASGQTTRRAFCAACGSPLFGLPGSAPEVVTIRVGSLDDPSVFRPSLDIYTISAQPWDVMNPDVSKVPKMPEEEPSSGNNL